MEIENCNKVLVDCGNGPCILEEVKKLPKLADADCNVIYRDLNTDLWIKTDDGWQQVNKDKNSHVPAKVLGNDGIEVSASGTDNQNFIVNGSKLQDQIDQLKQSEITIEGEHGINVNKGTDQKFVVSAKELDESIGNVKKTADSAKELAEKNSKNTHVKATITGDNGISVKASGTDNQTFVLNSKKIQDDLSSKQDQITNRVQTTSDPFYTLTTSDSTAANYRALKRGQEGDKHARMTLNEGVSEGRFRNAELEALAVAQTNQSYVSARKYGENNIIKSNGYLRIMDDSVSLRMLNDNIDNFFLRVSANPLIMSSDNVLNAWRTYLQYQPTAYKKTDSKFGNGVTFEIVNAYEYVQLTARGTIDKDVKLQANTKLKILSFPNGMNDKDFITNNDGFYVYFQKQGYDASLMMNVNKDGLYVTGLPIDVVIPSGAMVQPYSNGTFHKQLPKPNKF